jgi:cbb3-type cytochrome oxidase cytochrome c subunit
VIETPPVKQQGPDLINVADRVDYGFARKWILDPKKVDPNTKMTVPGITQEQVDAVRMFVWKTSMEAKGQLASR